MQGSTIGWLLVLFAGCLEVIWPIGMKNSQNFTKWGWVIVMFATLTASFALLSLAVSRYKLPIGTSYAVWTGMGAAGAVVLGVLLFKESTDFWRMFFVGMVIVGIVGLKATHTEPAEPTSSGTTSDVSSPSNKTHSQ